MIHKSLIYIILFAFFSNKAQVNYDSIVFKVKEIKDQRKKLEVYIKQTTNANYRTTVRKVFCGPLKSIANQHRPPREHKSDESHARGWKHQETHNTRAYFYRKSRTSPRTSIRDRNHEVTRHPLL